jgi:hypothetical protein
LCQAGSVEVGGDQGVEENRVKESILFTRRCEKRLIEEVVEEKKPPENHLFFTA